MVRPNVLFFGNGINRTFNFDSWDDLLNNVAKNEFTKEELSCLENIPYPLKPVIMTNDCVDKEIKDFAPILTQLCPCEEEIRLLKGYTSLPFDSILTTNYTYEIEKTLEPSFSCLSGKPCKWRKVADEGKKRYFMRQFSTFFDCGSKRIWHIHGEAARYDTMVLGHYFYGKELSKIQQYVSALIARHKSCISRNAEIEYKSWIDYFMLGDLYVSGFGMDLSEFDFWWMVNCKKRNFGETKITVFEPKISTEKRLLANAYNIEIDDSIPFNGDYKKYHNEVIQKLKTVLV